MVSPTCYPKNEYRYAQVVSRKRHEKHYAHITQHDCSNCIVIALTDVSLVWVQWDIRTFIGAVDATPVANLDSVVSVCKLLRQWPPLLWRDPHAQQVPLALFFLHSRQAVENK